MMDMGVEAADMDMTTTETGDIMKEDNRCSIQYRDVVSTTISIRCSLMKRLVRAICTVALTFSVIMGAGSFSIASASGSDYYENRDHHSREKRVYKERHRRAYHICANSYRVGGHRFQRCMDNYLGDYHRW